MSSSVGQNSAGISRPKILLLGKSGQVGGDLYPLLSGFSEFHAPDRQTVDLLRPDSIRECIRSFRPDVIVNAAAYTTVDKAESEPELASAINATAPVVLAKEAADLRSLLIHYSTDYVFDGTKTEPYIESDPTNPPNVYGKSKAAGEQAIRNSGCDHLIFRTSWIYAPRGSNFLLTMLKLARERDELRIVDDQIGAPTSSMSIASATVQVLRRWLQDPSMAFRKSGTYHMTASGYGSWFDFANEIFRQYGKQSLRVRAVIPISSTEYPQPACRPMNSRLDCSKISDAFGVRLPQWQASLSFVIESLSGGTSVAAKHRSVDGPA